MIERSVAILDALAKHVDRSDGCDDDKRLGVDDGGVVACAVGAQGGEGMVKIDVIRKNDDEYVGLSDLIYDRGVFSQVPAQPSRHTGRVVLRVNG